MKISYLILNIYLRTKLNYNSVIQSKLYFRQYYVTRKIHFCALRDPDHISYCLVYIFFTPDPDPDDPKRPDPIGFGSATLLLIMYYLKFKVSLYGIFLAYRDRKVKPETRCFGICSLGGDQSAGHVTRDLRFKIKEEIPKYPKGEHVRPVDIEDSPAVEYDAEDRNAIYGYVL